MRTREEAQARIRALIAQKERAVSDINEIVRELYPDYHFLDHWVSHFWRCEPSPFGYCLFERYIAGGDLVLGNCVFCGDPVERK